jgi:hypothetical protein
MCVDALTTKTILQNIESSCISNTATNYITEYPYELCGNLTNNLLVSPDYFTIIRTDIIYTIFWTPTVNCQNNILYDDCINMIKPKHNTETISNQRNNIRTGIILGSVFGGVCFFGLCARAMASLSSGPL